MTISASEDRSTELRDTLVQQLRGGGWLTSSAVQEAIRAVRREQFMPATTPLDDAYHVDRSVVTKRDPDGVPTSSVSAAYIQAAMLEQACLKRGHRVLEVGSGGLNAAYIAQIVGEDGEVVSIDIDADVTARAATLLKAAGYGDRVKVLTVDAGQGLPDGGVFDAIIVTVGVWDIPATLLAVLAPSGTIVVPLIMNGVTRTIAFRRQGEHLISTSVEVAGFVALQGISAHPDQVVPLSDNRSNGVGLRFDSGAPSDMSILDGALTTDRITVGSGVPVADGESFADLSLWFAWFMPGFCRVDSARDAVALKVDGGHWFPFGVVREAGFAYLTVQSVASGPQEFAACAYGGNAQGAADALVEQVRRWDRDGRAGSPSYAYWPSGCDSARLSGDATLAKANGVLTCSWPR